MHSISVLQCAAVCCSLLQCAAVWHSVLQCAAVCCSVLQCDAVCCSVAQCAAVCCSVMQCVAVCCSVLQCTSDQKAEIVQTLINKIHDIQLYTQHTRVCVYTKYEIDRTCIHKHAKQCTGWRRLIGSPKLQIIFHKRATKYRSLLREMTYNDKGSYESSPPCTTCTEYYPRPKVEKSHYGEPRTDRFPYILVLAGS